MTNDITQWVFRQASITLKAFKHTIVTMLLLFTAACSTVDTGIQYYSLNAIEAQSKAQSTFKNDEGKTFVILKNIELADFLNTGGLVMQVDTHQIQISNQHRWGDKLPKAITTHLINSLSNKTESALFIEQKNVYSNTLADKNLSLYFEQFTIASQANNELNETVISGYYHIESKGENENQKTFFDIRQPLTTDGYNHAVENFKSSLNTLSEQLEIALLK